MGVLLTRWFGAWRRSVGILAAVALLMAWPAARASAQHHGGHGGHGGHYQGARGGYGGYYRGGYYRGGYRPYGPAPHGYGRAYPGHYAAAYPGYPYRRSYAPHVGVSFSIGSPLPPGYSYYSGYPHAYGNPWQIQVMGGYGGYPIASYGYRGGGWGGCN
jgi:hypothetical protein